MKQGTRLISVLMFLATALLPLGAFGDSQARIVRLSQVEGDIQIDRGQGFQEAFLNLPVTEGAKLQAGSDGYAEVEFEDSSTIRITPGSLIEFPTLVLRDSGSRATTVHVVEGTAYVSYLGSKSEEFLVSFGHEKLQLFKAAHIRLEMDHSSARLSVLNGTAVQVEGPLGLVEVGKRKSVAFAINDDDPTTPTAATKMAKIQYDAWDEQQEEYRERYSNSKNGASSNVPYAFGMSDLNYFGSFFNAGGCGMAWRPFFATANWDPFAAGSWAWYPGNGYSWVSAYPWGWMPYHYGSWQMCPGYGWAWQPGGLWTGIVNAPNPVIHPHIIPPPPTAPPVVPGPRLPPNRRLRLVPPGATGLVAIRQDSAGLGIPRGAFANMHRVSQQFAHRGSANAVFYAQSGPSAIYGRSTAAMPAGSSASSGPSASSWRAGSGSHSGTASYSHSSTGPSMTHQGASASAPASSSRSSGGSTPHK